MVKIRQIFFILIFAVVVVKPERGGVTEGSAHPEKKGEITIANFSDREKFYDNWKSFKEIPAEQFRLRSENSGAYLEIIAKGDAVPIVKQEEFDPKEYPLLSWEWRVIELPHKGNEAIEKYSDSAAGIYVIFSKTAQSLFGLSMLKRFWRYPSWTPDLVKPETIKYVWSASLDVGYTTESPYSEKTKIVVLENYTSPLNRWVGEKINIYEDYKRLFHKEPSQVYGIGLLTDADNTKSEAVAHYGSIVRKKPGRLDSLQKRDVPIVDFTHYFDGGMHHVNRMKR